MISKCHAMCTAVDSAGFGGIGEVVKLQFLFGQPVLPAKPIADGPRQTFILGAYPSALHISWHVPGQRLPIRAVAVDNEPEPFWTGEDEQQRINRWCEAVSFSSRWGRVEPCGQYNGSSGVWVRTRVLDAFRIQHTSAWITDCLDTYHESTRATNRLDSNPISEAIQRLGIAPRHHLPHPSQTDIVKGAVRDHLRRLSEELHTARPDRIVTLGNAALQVFNSLVQTGGSQIRRLSADETYGTALSVRVDGRPVEWIPLAHPAAPKVYQVAHDRWMKGVK